MPNIEITVESVESYMDTNWVHYASSTTHSGSNKKFEFNGKGYFKVSFRKKDEEWDEEYVGSDIRRAVDAYNDLPG